MFTRARWPSQLLLWSETPGGVLLPTTWVDGVDGGGAHGVIGVVGMVVTEDLGFKIKNTKHKDHTKGPTPYIPRILDLFMGVPRTQFFGQ